MVINPINSVPLEKALPNNTNSVTHRNGVTSMANNHDGYLVNIFISFQKDETTTSKNLTLLSN
jgi:hypothetical protein